MGQEHAGNGGDRIREQPTLICGSRGKQVTKCCRPASRKRTQGSKQVRDRVIASEYSRSRPRLHAAEHGLLQRRDRPRLVGVRRQRRGQRGSDQERWPPRERKRGASEAEDREQSAVRSPAPHQVGPTSDGLRAKCHPHKHRCEDAANHCVGKTLGSKDLSKENRSKSVRERAERLYRNNNLSRPRTGTVGRRRGCKRSVRHHPSRFARVELQPVDTKRKERRI